MLDNEKMSEYLKKANDGDTTAKEEIYKNNLPLLKFIVAKFADKGVEYDDLFQIASMGLLKAIKNYNPDFGTKFTTYTVPMVIGEIKRYMRDNGAIKVSRTIKQLSGKIGKFADEYFLKNQHTPTVSEIAKAVEADEYDVVMALNSSKMPVSIYEQCDDDDNGMELLEKLPAGETEDCMLTRIQFKEMIEDLSESEKKVIVMRYYRDKTQSEIAADLGVSQVQVSRIENKVLKKMRSIV